MSIKIGDMEQDEQLDNFILRMWQIRMAEFREVDEIIKQYLERVG